jgi:hypothetical protein
MVEALSKKEIAAAYSISGKTLNRWLKLIPLSTGSRNILTPSEVSIVFSKYGKPK